MGWEINAAGCRYYTRSRKVNDRVVREYIGTGPAAEAIAQLDAIEREQRQRASAAWQEEKAELAALDDAIDDVCRLSDVLLRVELAAADFHQHKR